MGWRGVLRCTAALLHYSSHPETIRWIAPFFFPSSFYTFGARKQRFVEGWMISTCDLCPFLMFTGRTRTQLNWGKIKQTHQTSRLLQCQSSRRKTLIKHVGSQTRWREETQVCSCFFCVFFFLYLTRILSGKWKVGVSSHFIHMLRGASVSAAALMDRLNACRHKDLKARRTLH